jgi:hypothetical protein
MCADLSLFNSNSTTIQQHNSVTTPLHLNRKQCNQKTMIALALMTHALHPDEQTTRSFKRTSSLAFTYCSLAMKRMPCRVD